MGNHFVGKRVLLGVSGSIASYKAVDLASKISQLGVEVDVILSAAASHFVSPITFQSVSGRRTYVDKDLWGADGHVLHIGLGRAADLLLVAPATANTIAKLASGQADNLLALTALVAECPLLIAPAMDGGMYSHPATQANIKNLQGRGAQIIGPLEGHLASGLKGLGRMVEPEDLLGYVRSALGQTGPLASMHIVVSAGGTQEAIDPVRVIANRSSGKQGYALAQAALDLGAKVTLVSAPTALKAPIGADLLQVKSALDMQEAVVTASKKADALLMAAAVADFRPKDSAEEKIKRSKGVPIISLIPNPDILITVSESRKKSGYPKVLVGFAAESQDLARNAREKLKSKNLDFLVANDISALDAGFEVDTNRVLLIDKNGESEQLELMTKIEVAEHIIGKVAAALSK